MLLRQNLVDLVHNHLVSYPTPANLNYFWGAGSTAGILLGCQLVTGILLAMHYAPTVDLAFSSLEHIMRDVNYGWFLRYVHANGASFFFLLVYVHLGRSFVYGLYTYSRRFLWFSGLVIFILMMAIAFMGYVLPWGQMSFWGATVITNLFSVIPLAGDEITYWLWGDFSVGNATLNRFFSLHFALPFILAAMVCVHLAVLHQAGSSSVFGVVKHSDKIFFYPYFYVKDYLGVMVVGFCFLFTVTYAPDALGHPDNYILANPLVTPTHIVPEWYFLPYYALLRSIPNKLAGVLVMGLSLLVCLVLPFCFVVFRSTFYQGRLFYRWLAWGFVFLVIILGFLGGQSIEMPYSLAAQIFALCYFSFFFFLVLADYVYANYVFFAGMQSPIFGYFLSLYSVTGPSQVIQRRSSPFTSAMTRLVRSRLALGRRAFKNTVFRFKNRMRPSVVAVVRRSRLRFTFFKSLLKPIMVLRLQHANLSYVKSNALLFAWNWSLAKTERVTTAITIGRSHVAKNLYLTQVGATEPEYQHPFHLVTVSPWPFSISFSISMLLLGVMAFFHRYAISDTLMFLGLGSLAYVMYRWFVDISREGTLDGSHLDKVQWGLKSGMLLFITSEVLFFFAFFWSFFHASLAPAIQIGGVWPPVGITVFNPWSVPLLNTVILLTSGAAVTWAHFAVRASTKVLFRPVATAQHGIGGWQAQSLFVLAQFLGINARGDATQVVGPTSRVRVVTHFSYFFDLYRRWSFHVYAQYGTKKTAALALRRHVAEFSATLALFLSHFALSGAGVDQFFKDVGMFRLRRTVYFTQFAQQRIARFRRFSLARGPLSAIVASARARAIVGGTRLKPVFVSPFIYILKMFREFNPCFTYAFGLRVLQFFTVQSWLVRSRHDVLYGFALTIFLGALFTMIQYYEYIHATFTIADSVYGTTFFLTTGFHGLHVMVGTLLLLVSFKRMLSYQFTKAHHVGMEAAIWYWHFVDVVWLGLYISVYHWGGQF